MIKKERENIWKRKERENIYKKRRKKGKELQDGCSSSRPLLRPPRPMAYTHYLFVWPSLAAHLSWTKCNHATATAALKLHPRMLPKNTLSYVKVNKNSPNSFTHTCLHEIIQMHVSLIYVICSGLDASSWYIHRSFKN